jgi:hypothetical protein
MAASSDFTSAKTKGEGLYTSFRAVLDSPPAKDKDEKARTLYDNPDYQKTINPKLKAPPPDSVVYFKRLGLNTANELVRGRIAYQGTDKREDYNNWYRPADGLLVAIRNDSRRSQGGLLHWSDAAFSQWSEVCGGEPHKLCYIIQDRVENKPSEAIIKEAHRLAGIPIEKGMTWTRASHPDEFHAILGSPNGYGVVYMLRDHCAALRKDILSIDTYEFYYKEATEDGSKGADDGLRLYIGFKLG